MKNIMLYFIACFLVLNACFVKAEKAMKPSQKVLIPTSIEMFYLQPNTETELTWKKNGNEKVSTFTIKDFSGLEVKQGAVEEKEGMITLKLNLAQGYYQLCFPEVKEYFGLVVLPKLDHPADSFFCIDTAWSWLEHSPKNRKSLLNIIKQYGIRTCRERLSWGKMKSASARSFKHVRNEFKNAGMKMLEVHHDSPKAMNKGKGGYMVIPTELGAVSKEWTDFTKEWQPVWNSVETWNEENDEIFCSNSPVDRYASYHKTLAATIHNIDPDIAILNGGFTSSVKQAYLNDFAENGMLDWLDGVSFHYYSKPEEMADTLKKYRDWMTAYNRPTLPLWITECSSPRYDKGMNNWENIQNQYRRAVESSMIVCEAKAGGVAKVFPFVMAHYPIEGNHFSMLCHHRSPLPLVACYFQVIQRLSGQEYVGSIPMPSPVKIIRVFRKNEQATVVVYTKTSETIKHDILSKGTFFGADGRFIKSNIAETVPVPDGLTFVNIPWASIEDTVVVPSKRYSRSAVNRPFASLVMQFLPDNEMSQSLKRGYTFDRKPAKQPELKVRIWNFSENTSTALCESKHKKHNITVAGRGYVDVCLPLDMDLSSKPTPYYIFLKNPDGKVIDKLMLKFSLAPSVEELCKEYQTTKVNFNSQKMDGFVPNKGKISIAPMEDNFIAVVDLKTCSGIWNNWGTVKVDLANFDLKGKSGIIFRSRITGEGWANVNFELRNNDRFRSERFTVDGVTHDHYVPFKSAANKYFSSKNKAKANKAFKIEDITAVEFVIHSRSMINAMEISDLYLAEKLPKDTK